MNVGQAPAMIFGAYFIPTAMAAFTRQANQVFIVNLFLGWTLIGWVVSLTWAFKPAKA
ncbi:MAG: superinfection immunity protein [Patescibacteria group bacterium]|nr:superinfection immunity protein [Patescibacteria group bacterium]